MAEIWRQRRGEPQGFVAADQQALIRPAASHRDAAVSLEVTGPDATWTIELTRHEVERLVVEGLK